MKKQLEEMDNYMQRWLSQATELTDIEFHWSKDQDSWSIQQVLMHVVKIQQISVDALQKAYAKHSELKNTEIKNTISSAILKFALRSGKKFKAPQIAAHIDNHVSLATVRQQWENANQALNQFVEAYPIENKNKLIFKHPFVGWLSLEQALDFLLEHLKHHRKQIESLYSQLKSK